MSKIVKGMVLGSVMGMAAYILTPESKGMLRRNKRWASVIDVEELE